MGDTSQVEVLKPPIRRTWWKESAVYQIYPASFKSANCTVDKNLAEVKGDLRGIISKLDYIKELGVDIVWLSPILQSPQVDMGYDISDYRAIDALYGTMEDHDDLIKGLHDRGLKYVMDLVVNHTSDQHEWFRQSRSSKDNPYRDWYFWRPPRYDEAGNRMPPNNWESAFSGSTWTYDETTDEYYLHIFASAQPDLNWDNHAVRDAVDDMIRFWLDRGVDGFRMDVINFISKAPGLPDGKITKPGFLQSGVEHFACGPRLHEYLRGIGAILHEYDGFSVGEMPGVTDTREILKAVGQDRGELAMAFQFDIVTMDIEPGAGSKWEHRDFEPRALKHVVAKWQSFMLENAGWNAVFMENHDQGRTISRYCDDSEEYRTKSAKLLAAHMGLQSGTLFIYQGQELAQINVPESWGLDKYKDIEVINHWKTVLRDYPDDKDKQAAYKRQYRLIGRDNARTPMQWTSDAGTFAGFLPDDRPKDAKPWMSIYPDFERWNAEAQLSDWDSAFLYWQRILALRKQHKDIFVYGDFEMLDVDNDFPNVVAYLRSDRSAEHSQAENEKPGSCLVIANFSKDRLWWRVPEKVEGILFDGRRLRSEAIRQDLRNYTGSAAGDNATERDARGWKIDLMAWEVVVAVA
ncbi:trehalose-6-phosphate hydrolase [Cladophialophora yegresii CBS 114405]|uniref:Trehalose-6-phosphate hydrolase n=1 Tax=Cladophialophora yegresii CBS 114405 TaxID=1182544 RepID=W9VPR7_9EURO|nr:trehalose-6-phosphate hydrolase [Cladophialophora yegresii CBS 114405]EXJ57538.1 trehalose-6-phosphate hydrolase [Cladophialophora yegresii CBS 114405]